MKSEVNKKIVFSKGGKGAVSPRVGLVGEWIRDMGILETSEKKDIILNYDKEKKIITIRKKEE